MLVLLPPCLVGSLPLAGVGSSADDEAAFEGGGAVGGAIPGGFGVVALVAAADDTLRPRPLPRPIPLALEATEPTCQI
jgi:hypothetical protein